MAAKKKAAKKASKKASEAPEKKAVAKKPEKKDAEEKVVKTKPDGEVKITHSKSYEDREINPYTGTRHRPNTSQQKAFDIVFEGAKAGKTVDEIKKQLAETRKDNGAECNLDSGYFNFVVATNHEFFKVYREDGVLKIDTIKDPEIDQTKIAELEEKEAKKKAAREARKTGAKTKPSKKAKSKPKKKPEAQEESEEDAGEDVEADAEE